MSHQNPSSCTSNLIQRDRFELLSAYMDGEVTAAERRQVEAWLASDPTVQRLHARLLKLRQGFQTMPVPSSQESTEQIVDQVLARVERKSKRPLVWAGAAIAATFVGVLVSVLSGDRSPLPQVAVSPQQPTLSAPQSEPANETLLVALDKPLVAIPKAPVAVSSGPVKDAAVRSGASNH